MNPKGFPKPWRRGAGMVLVLKRYSWSLHFITIALCSYLLAQSISTLIAARLGSSSPPVETAAAKEKEVLPEEESSIDDYAVIAERNIFNSAASGQVALSGGEVSPEQVGELGPAVKSSLDVKLLSALVVGEGTDRRSSATISGGKQKGADVYFVGDEKSFAENVRLTKVIKDRIEFLNGNRLEYVELEDFAKQKSIFAKAEEVHGTGANLGKGGTEETATGVAAEENKIIVEQKAIDDALANLDRFYTEIRIVPNFKEGRVAGMKVLSVKPGSVVGKLGIRRGDILERINGQELDVKRGMELFNELKDQKSFSIDVVRGGQNKTLEYEIR